MKKCIFCEIVAGNLPAAKIFESNHFLVILDKHPLFYGHCLLLPKVHYPTLVDLPPDLNASFFQTLRQLTTVVEVGMQSTGSLIAINNKVSQSVPHLHVHVVPRNRGDGLKGFFWPRKRYDDSACQSVQHTLQETWHKLHLQPKSGSR